MSTDDWLRLADWLRLFVGGVALLYVFLTCGFPPMLATAARLMYGLHGH